ncbi:MAG: DUF2125 domain-containing protein [Alphaproteobacteria bacterium]
MRRFLSLSLGLFGAIVIAHAVFWWSAADEMQVSVESWIDDWRAKGYRVTHGELAVGGYPLAVQASLPYPSVEDPGKVWSWQAEGVRLQTRLWQPLRYEMTIQGEQAVTVPINGRPVDMSVTTSGNVITADFSTSGRLVSGSVQLDDLKGSAPDLAATVLARRLVVELDLPRKPPVLHTDRAGHVTLIADELTLPQAYAGPLGPDLDRISVRFNALGPLKRGDLRTVLGDWRDSGGVVEIPWLRGEWGELTVDAKGTVALDESFRPLAAFESAFGGLSPTLDLLAQAGVIQKRNVRLVKLGLALLSSTSASGKPVMKLPMTIQDGQVYLGPVAVAYVRPILPPDGNTVASDEPPAPALAPVPPPVEEMPLLEEPPVVEWQ